MVLSDALNALQTSKDPNLLVGFETGDDAAVYKLSPESALVSTVDFITPPVDDPYWFGQIAAANAISDIYAMGGKPVTALNVVMFPSKILDVGILREILRGGNDKIIEAGASLAGGHTVEDAEPKYGLCVTGIVHPEKILTNTRAQIGDQLILTKPLGTGVLFNAVKAGKLSQKDLEGEVLPSIVKLNATSIKTALRFNVHSCTDVTGFGIIGHSAEMALGSKVKIALHFSELPFFPDVFSLYQQGVTTGSNKANRQLCEKKLNICCDLTSSQKEALFDPQTSGGLLLSVPCESSGKLVNALHQAGIVDACIIGEVIDGEPGVDLI